MGHQKNFMKEKIKNLYYKTYIWFCKHQFDLFWLFQMNKRKFVIAIDFDGTIVENTYPTIGNIKQDVVEVIKTLIFKDNCEIIIWTCREGKYLQDAIKFLNKNFIPYHYINDNCNWAKETFSYNANCRKIFADLYIDDKAIFAKIKWKQMYDEIIKIKNLKKIYL